MIDGMAYFGGLTLLDTSSLKTETERLPWLDYLSVVSNYRDIIMCGNILLSPKASSPSTTSFINHIHCHC